MPSNTVDISAAGITIPEGADIYIGYLISQANSSYPIVTDADEPKEGGFFLHYGFSTSEPPAAEDWADANFDLEWGSGNTLITFSVEEPYRLDEGTTLQELGISYIDIPSRELVSGETLPLKLLTPPSEKPAELRWFFDGYPVQDASVTLSAGNHLVSVTLIYSDGKKDHLETQIVVR